MLRSLVLSSRRYGIISRSSTPTSASFTLAMFTPMYFTLLKDAPLRIGAARHARPYARLELTCQPYGGGGVCKWRMFVCCHSASSIAILTSV